MNNKFLILINAILFILIILNPWLLFVLEPVIVYLINVLVCFILLASLIKLSEQVKNKKSKEDIISLTAHQLSAPLSNIKWSLEMLFNEDFGKINEEQKTIIKKTQEKNEKLIHAVNDLLGESENNGKKYLLNKSWQKIENLVLGVYESYKDDMENKKISFNLVIMPPEKLPEIKIDSQKIKLVIQNLFDNAIRYTHPGGKITVSVKNKGKFIEFKIQDSGIGIEKSQIKKVFNKFFRGSNASQHDPMGHGLGLFFAKNIIKAHGGKIWFNSKEGQGSSFYFTLPIN